MAELTATDRLLAMSTLHHATTAPRHLPGEPALQTAVLACMDARLDVTALFGLTPGDAHVIRNAGGSATDDALRSLAVSQREMGTREVVVVQHTRCGMTTFDGEEFRERVVAETGVEPAWRSAGTFADVEQNVRDTVARITGDPALPRTDRVRGFVYDVDSGALTEVAPGAPGAPGAPDDLVALSAVIPVARYR